MSFVITATSNKLDRKYMGIEAGSGLLYWSRTLQNAKFFDSKEEALRYIRGSEFKREVTMSDGSIYPPGMLQSGAELNNLNPSGTVRITISRVEMTTVLEYNFSVEIKRPAKLESSQLRYLGDVLLHLSLAASWSEAHRYLRSGIIKVNSEVVRDPMWQLNKGDVVSRGKTVKVVL
jgi:hypothetical protein